MANKYLNRCSISLIIRETQINHNEIPLYAIKMAKIKTTDLTKFLRGYGGTRTLIYY